MLVGLALILGGVALASGAVTAAAAPHRRDRPARERLDSSRRAGRSRSPRQLYSGEDVRPFLAAAGRYDRDGIADQLGRDPERAKKLTVELDGERAWRDVWAAD